MLPAPSRACRPYRAAGKAGRGAARGASSEAGALARAEAPRPHTSPVSLPLAASPSQWELLRKRTAWPSSTSRLTSPGVETPVQTPPRAASIPPWPLLPELCPPWGTGPQQPPRANPGLGANPRQREPPRSPQGRSQPSSCSAPASLGINKGWAPGARQLRAESLLPQHQLRSRTLLPTRCRCACPAPAIKETQPGFPKRPGERGVQAGLGESPAIRCREAGGLPRPSFGSRPHPGVVARDQGDSAQEP